MRLVTKFLMVGACLLALFGSADAATLTITNNGTNPGATSVTPVGQVCNPFGGGTCTLTITNGTTITLAANSPTTPGTFNSGTGDAAGCGTSTCTFTINSDSSITTTYNAGAYPSITVGLAGAGKGEVGMNAGRCQNYEVGFSACTQFYAPGSVVTLQGRNVVANNFAGYSGGAGDAAACATSPCSFTLNANASVTASFVPLVAINVTPQNSIIEIGQNQFYTANGSFTNGSTRPLFAGAGVWNPRNNLPSARFSNAVVTVGNQIFSIGGTTFGGPPLSNMDRYEAATGAFGQQQTWTARAPLPQPRESLAAAVVAGKIYAVGGHTTGGVSVATLDEYDVLTNTWTPKASMPTPRAGLSAAALNGKLYVAGGGAGGASSTTFEAYDPTTDSWATLAPMSTPRRYAAMVAVEGVVLAIAGDATGMAVEAYNPGTDSWSPRASLPQSRMSAGAAVVSGLTYLVGGFGGMQPTLVYNTVSDFWTQVASLPTPRGQMGVTQFDGRIWVVGGLTAIPGPPGFAASNALHAFRPAEMHFTSSNYAIAGIASNGSALGINPGTVIIRARAGSITCGLPGQGICATLTVAEPEPEECAIVQFSLAPGSAVFGQVLIEIFDPETGEILDPASPAPIGVQFEVTPGVYGLRFIAPAGYTVSPSELVQTVNCDDNVNIPLNFALIDTTAPSVTATAAGVLWPPNGKMVPVTVTGNVSDAGSGIDASSATFTVVDEYGVVQPSGAVTVAPNGIYSFTVLLEASRKGTDKDGRTYTVVVSVEDNNGNVGTAAAVATVPHDQGRK